MTHNEASTDGPQDRPTGAYPYYVLAILFLIYVMNIADRQVLGILAEDVKRDLGLNDSQMGLLLGPAIALFYAIMGVPMAYAADRVNRVRFLSVSLLIWSVMTILAGRAANLWQLAATRVGVSIAEAGATPSTVSLIADYFGPRRRATAMAIWTTGATVGVFVGFSAGGVINEHVGWRNTLAIAGMTGTVLVLLSLLTLKEPQRGCWDGDTAVAKAGHNLSMVATFLFLWKIPRFRTCVMASCACNFCVFSLLGWMPAFAVRTFDVGTAKAGSVLGTGIAVVGSLMIIISGAVYDRWRVSGGKPLVAVAIALFVSALFLTSSLFAGDFTTCAILFTIGYGALMVNTPVTWATLQSATPPHMRAMGASILLLAIALTATMPAPLLVGMSSDALQPSFGRDSLKIALLFAPAAAIVGAFFFLLLAHVAGRRAE